MSIDTIMEDILRELESLSVNMNAPIAERSERISKLERELEHEKDYIRCPYCGMKYRICFSGLEQNIQGHIAAVHTEQA